MRKSFQTLSGLVRNKIGGDPVDDAAVRAAIVYSLVDTCKSRGVDPRGWMEDVLVRIPGNENGGRSWGGAGRIVRLVKERRG